MDESFLIVGRPSPLEGKEEHKLEYIKEMISLVREDMKHVMLYITLGIAMIALFISQIAIKELVRLPFWARLILCGGIAALTFSALFFFRYIRHLHITQMKITRCLPSVDVIRARELWAGKAGVWQQHKRNYVIGKSLLGMGTVCLSVTLFHLFLFPAGSGNLGIRERGSMDIIDNLLPQNKTLEQRDTKIIDLIVLHCTELPTLEEARRAAEEMRNTDAGTQCVSGHYYVDRDGRVYRYVEDNRIANHVTGYNRGSIGIEIVNKGRYPRWYSSGGQNPTEEYTPAQVASIIRLIEYLKRRYPNINKIARHSELDIRWVPAEDDDKVEVRRKIDPGPLFPWEEVLEAWHKLQN